MKIRRKDPDKDSRIKYANDKERILKNVKEQWHERLQSYCWIWQLEISNAGYGRVRARVQGKRVRPSAHRFSYEAFVGPIPEGLQITHKCDVRACCNPAHLEPDTHQGNMDDMKRRDRQAKGPRVYGAKLSDTLAIEIDTKWNTGNYTQTQLAKEYGVNKTSINSLVRRKTYSYLFKKT